MADLGTINCRAVGVSREPWFPPRTPTPGVVKMVTTDWRRHIPVSTWQQYRLPTCKTTAPALTVRGDYADGVYSDFTGVLAGTVLDGATPVPGVEVAIFLRKTKRLAFVVRSAADGTFSVPNVAKDSATTYNALFFAVAFDPTGTSNAVIFDNVTPT